MHGGDIYNNKIEYDFSVNLNPYAPYKEVVYAAKKAVDRAFAYPEYDSKRLYIALENAINVSTNNICITNGASEAIVAIVNTLKPVEIVMEVPSFSGYEHAALSLENTVVKTIDREELFALKEQDIRENSLFFIANPTNPVGELSPQDSILKLYEKIKNRNAYLVLDECFLPLTEHESSSLIYKISEDCSYFSGLFIVRSFTKSFGIPGIRLGYFVSGNNAIITKVISKLPEWNISLIAQEAGIACLENIMRLKEDCKKISVLRSRLAEELNALGLDTAKSEACYILFTAKKGLYEFLLGKKILVRDCSDYKGIEKIKMQVSGYRDDYKELEIYRIAVKTAEDNKIIISAIKEFCLNQ